MTTETARKYYLYHKISPLGLNYLGYTGNLDPYKYKGNGTRWKLHLKKHGFGSKDIQTIILLESHDKEEIKTAGLYYSRLYNVVESKDWANLTDESGDGAPIGRKLSEEHKIKIRKHLDQYRPHPPEVIAKIVRSRQGYRHSEESKKKISEAKKGRPGPSHSELTKEKVRQSKLGRKKPGVPVRNIATGEVFDSVRRAAESLGINEVTLCSAIRNKKSDCMFVYDDPDYTPTPKPSRAGFKFSDAAKANMKNNNKMAIRVRHKETGLIFSSITEAADWFQNIKRDTLNAQLKNNRRCEFEYYNE